MAAVCACVICAVCVGGGCEGLRTPAPPLRRLLGIQVSSTGMLSTPFSMDFLIGPDLTN